MDFATCKALVNPHSNVIILMPSHASVCHLPTLDQRATTTTFCPKPIASTHVQVCQLWRLYVGTLQLLWLFAANLDPCVTFDGLSSARFVDNLISSVLPTAMPRRYSCSLLMHCPAGQWCHFGATDEATVCCPLGESISVLLHHCHWPPKSFQLMLYWRSV